MSRKLNKYICLSRDTLSGDVDITIITAKDSETAWGIVEDEVMSNFSSEWLFDLESWMKFKKSVEVMK
jgi:hypothetical protein